MKPEELKPGTWLVIRDPLSGREYLCTFELRLSALFDFDTDLNHVWCSEWVGQDALDDGGVYPFTDSELVRHGRVLLNDAIIPWAESLSALNPQALQTPLAGEADDLQLPQVSPDVQAMAALSGTARAPWSEQQRLAQLARLHQRQLDKRDRAQSGVQQEGAAAAGHASTAHTPHTQSAGSQDGSGTAFCALRASIARSQKPLFRGQLSRPATVYEACPLKLYEHLLILLHPVKQWIPAPVRRLVVRTYLTALILSSCERVVRKRNAKGGDHA